MLVAPRTDPAPAAALTPRASVPVLLVLVATGAWLVAHAAGLLGPLEVLTFPLLTVAAIAAILVGVRRYQPAVAWPWYWLGAGFVLFLVGGIARTSLHTLGDLSSHRSLLPDFLTIPGYLFSFFGLFGIVRARQRGRASEIDALLDAGVAALAAMALGWLYVVNPHEMKHSTLALRMTLAAYPTLSIFLVAITAGLAFSAGTRKIVANNLLLGAMVWVLLGDFVYALLEIHAINIPATAVDLPYALGYVFIIATVLHPSMRQLTEPLPAVDDAPTLSRLVVVAVALAVPGLMTVTRVDAPLGDRIAMGVIVLTLTAAAITRLFRAVRAHAVSEARLVHQATHDLLTGLPNRAYVQEYVGRALARAQADPAAQVALLFLDVDRFKLVNDTYGHTLGDAFLLAVAERLRTSIRPSDLVARIGGDEFVVVAQGIRSTSDAVDLANRTRQLFAQEFRVPGADLTSSVSIGVALTDGSDVEVDAETMIRDADTAMYRAKDSGRDAVAVFNPSMRDQVSRRLDLERELHHALERNEFQVHYQPVVDIASGAVRGFEALLRWNHPAWGLISPLTFIPVAEDTGLIVDIGSWVLGEACRQMEEWRTTLPSGREMTMSVNVSARQLRDHSIVGRVQRALYESQLPRTALTLELTESSLMDDPNGAPELLGRLKSLGVGLAIDDFGTGYSSLAYLRRFPVDIVKIDRAFVTDLEQDTADASLIAAIVAMSDALGVTTIAEGVESETQAAHLLALGCSVAQGYLYARPIPPAEMDETIERLQIRARTRLRAVPDDAYSA